ncbi:hypothetical protein WDU94_015053, partial [Cyamophila willieti]
MMGLGIFWTALALVLVLSNEVYSMAPVRKGSLVRRASYNYTKALCGNEMTVQGSSFECDEQFCVAIKQNLEDHEYCTKKREFSVDLHNTRCIKVESSLLTKTRLKEVCMCAFVENQEQKTNLIPYLVYERRNTYSIFNYVQLDKKPYQENLSMVLPDKYFRHPLRYFHLGNALLYRQLTGYINTDRNNCKIGSLRIEILPP